MSRTPITTMPRDSKRETQRLTAEYFINQTTPYNIRSKVITNPTTVREKQSNVMNQYHNLMDSLFHYHHIQQDLKNRLMIGAVSTSTIRLGRVPFHVYSTMCTEYGGRKKYDTYRTVHRELGSYQIAHTNFAFDGFENMPKFDGTGGWAMKILQYPILFGGVQIAITTYRLYYTKLHFFYNMERSLLEAKFHYEVEVFNTQTMKWEHMSAPKKQNIACTK